MSFPLTRAPTALELLLLTEGAKAWCTATMSDRGCQNQNFLNHYFFMLRAPLETGRTLTAELMMRCEINNFVQPVVVER